MGGRFFFESDLVGDGGFFSAKNVFYACGLLAVLKNDFIIARFTEQIFFGLVFTAKTIDRADFFMAVLCFLMIKKRPKKQARSSAFWP